MMARAVRFDHYGGIDVLRVDDVQVPEPAEDEVVVEVRAAGTNPGEAAVREGMMDAVLPATFPSGQGSDLAGVVSAVGAGVSTFSVGDEVMGWSWRRSSQAEYCAVPANQLIRKPPALPWAVAGSLYVVGVTAFAAVRAVGPVAGDTVAVSAAAGGVGTVTVQLLRLRGAEVVGIASEPNHEWLRDHGVTPLSYGDGLADRLRGASPTGIDAFIDLFGPDYVRLAIEIGVRRDRIETIISYAAAQEFGIKAEGSGDATTPGILAEMADLVAAGHIDVPIAAAYPLDRVVDAYTQLEQRHTRGKIVLEMSPR
jgi:NADPH2:quinone reductase